jgi:hypothetical protein
MEILNLIFGAKTFSASFAIIHGGLTILLCNNTQYTIQNKIYPGKSQYFKKTRSLEAK